MRPGVKPAHVERVRKLRRLASSSNRHEAAQAAARAADAMRKYGLSEDDVADDLFEVIGHQDVDPYLAELARACAIARGCNLAVSRRGALAFAGRPVAVRGAMALYQPLAQAGRASCEMSGEGDPPEAARLAWRICWWMGYLEAIVRRLQAGEHLQMTIATEIPRGVVPEAAREALAAMDDLAAQLWEEGEVDDVEGVLHRLRERAHAAGEGLGERVPLTIRSAGFLRGI